MQGVCAHVQINSVMFDSFGAPWTAAHWAALIHGLQARILSGLLCPLCPGCRQKEEMHISDPCKEMLLRIRIIQLLANWPGTLSWTRSRRCKPALSPDAVRVWAFHSGWETSPDDSLGGVQT